MECPYCNETAQHIDSSYIYGISYGYIYYCNPCDARVGCHKTTGRPLGTMANASLRALRIETHNAFDPIWKKGGFTRRAAYIWLSRQMKIGFHECHIGKFDETRCRMAIEKCGHFVPKEK